MGGEVSDDDDAFRGDPFFDVPRRRVVLSTADVKMPALCRRVAVRMPLWFVPADRVAAKFARTGIVPRRLGRMAIVALSCFSFTFATVGAYNEVGLLVVARSARRYRGIGPESSPLRRIPRLARGLASVELALDNELALVGGRELFGLSKYLATVTHDFRGDGFEYALHDRESGRSTLTVCGRIGPGVVVRSPLLVNLSSLGGEVVRAEVNTDSSWRVGPACSVRVTCDPADGHLGGHVAALGLTQRRPFCVLAADDLRGRLNLAVRLSDGREVVPVGTGAAAVPTTGGDESEGYGTDTVQNGR